MERPCARARGCSEAGNHKKPVGKRARPADAKASLSQRTSRHPENQKPRAAGPAASSVSARYSPPVLPHPRRPPPAPSRHRIRQIKTEDGKRDGSEKTLFGQQAERRVPWAAPRAAALPQVLGAGLRF
jgi:hypothetical protein